MFWSALGFRRCVRAFSSCGEWELLFVAVRGLLIAVVSLCCRAWVLSLRASVVAARGLSSCGALAQLLRGMWDPPGPGLEPVSPALASGFLTTAPPGKSLEHRLEGGEGGSRVDIGRWAFQEDDAASAKALRWAFYYKAEPRTQLMILALPRRAP